MISSILNVRPKYGNFVATPYSYMPEHVGQSLFQQLNQNENCHSVYVDGQFAGVAKEFVLYPVHRNTDWGVGISYSIDVILEGNVSMVGRHLRADWSSYPPRIIWRWEAIPPERPDCLTIIQPL